MNAFREIFEQCFLVIGGVGLVLTLTALFLCAWNCWVSERISELCAAWKRSSFVTRVVSVAFVGILMVYASTKPPENGQEGRYLCLVSSLPEGQSEASDPDPHRGETILTREWNLPGAWQYSMRRQDFAGGFVFPYGMNHLACVHVSSQGSVRETRFSTNVIASVGVPLAVVPGLTECSHEYTVSNTYRFVWANAAAYRDTNTLVSASIELFRNGDVVVTTNGITRTIPRELPFEHDGYGQDESWVRANFAMLQDVDASLTNVEQVLSIGYTNWVDRLVGVGQLNGLYKFTAEFTEDPPETTQFWIGDFSLAVTNAGKYVVVLKKGEEYEFGTWPFNDAVDYWAQDDMSADAPMLTAWWGDWESPGEWSIDGGWNWFWRPSFSYGRYYKGCCAWGPTLQGSPDVAHLRESDFPKLFSAIVSDYPGSDDLRYEWRSSDDNIRIMSPHSKDTLIAVDSMPSWGYFALSVSTEIKGRSYTSSVTMCYGTNDTPVASLALSAPKVVFVNDDDRTSRWYRVSAKLSSPTPTNAVLAISHTGGAQVLYATDPEGKNLFTMANVNLSVDSELSSTGYDFYFTATNNNCNGKFTATCTLADSTVLSATGEYKVIEPLRKLVSTVVADDGSYVNPSRLTYGTNAWLQVDQNGTFPSQDIRWRVVSGPGEIVSSNRYRACVRATESSGTVVVEAAFGSDSLIQPRFVLPIVEKKMVPISVHYVLDSLGNKPNRLLTLDNDLDIANSIFSQVGVEFYLDGSPQAIANASYARLPEYRVEIGPNGRRRLSDCLSNNAIALFGMLPPSGDHVQLIYVHEITHGTRLAFSVPDYKVVVMGLVGTSSVLAHELGHNLGLEDIYSRKKYRPDVLMPGWNDHAYVEIFSDLREDWGDESGRAFYEVSDTHGELIDQLLMNGFNDFDGRDIPSGNVSGYSPQPANSFDKPLRRVGANVIRENVE